jgi:PD-(D/E)XK nuclease superfamily
MIPPKHYESPKFELGSIPAVSPTLAEILRNCPLQATFYRVPELKHFVVSNPKAWLGIAYHEVLEQLWLPRDDDSPGAKLVDDLWLAAIGPLRQKALAHPLDCRFETPEKWPGYYLVRACLSIRAQEALSRKSQFRSFGESVNVIPYVREKQLSAMGGKLIGKPDVISCDEIWDYKSGSIYDEVSEGTRVVKEGYVRQLLLYGHLVKENYGKYPAKGKLLPMQGEVVEIKLEPEVCAKEAVEAVHLLDSANAKLADSTDVSAVATPSAASCRWCKFKLVCPAFWQEVDETWAEELGNAAVRGRLKTSPALLHNGRAFSLSIDVTGGTTTATEVTVAPLDKEIHQNLSEFELGEEVRIVSLFLRRDGQLAPTNATVCYRESDCPSFSLHGGSQKISN